MRGELVCRPAADSATRWHPSTHLFHDLAQGDAHGYLDQARVPYLSRKGEHLGAFAALGSDRGEPCPAPFDDWWDIGKGLDVVDEGCATE
jgi:hypothetical protein